MGEWFEASGLQMEDSQSFQPSQPVDDKLTVKLWLGRDKRLLIADPISEDSRATA